MPALTDRERAKRAKMVARFNAIKHQNSMTSELSGLSGLDTAKHDRRDSGRLDVYLATKDEEVRDDGGSEEQAERADETPRPEVVNAQEAQEPVQESLQPEPALGKSAEPAEENPLSQSKPSPPPVNTASEPTLSVQIPSTPTKSTISVRNTPRSRRGASIADAKKRLAAARKVSSSPKPSVDKAVLREVASKFDERDSVKKDLQVDCKAEVDKVTTAEKNTDTFTSVGGGQSAETQQQTTILVNHDTHIKAKISITSPSAKRSDKIAKIRARSPRLADRHKGLLSTLVAVEKQEDEPKKRLSDDFGRVAREEPESQSSDEYKVANVPNKERWSDEFNESTRSHVMNEGAHLSDDFSKRLGYGSDPQTVSDELIASRMSDEFSSTQRMSIETATTEATGATLVAKDNVMENPQPKVKKTWQEQAKIAAKAKQYCKWQQHATPTKKPVEPVMELGSDEEETKENFGSYQATMQNSEAGRLMENEGYLFEPEPQVNNELLGFMGNKGGLFEPRPHHKSQEFGDSTSYDDQTGDECPLAPSQMAYFNENQEYHVDDVTADEEAQDDDSPDMSSPDQRFEMQDTKLKPVSLSQPSLSKSTSESSATKPTTARSTSQYKTLVPSTSDTSKYSEISLNQLTISVSDAQSFVPAEQESLELSPKLAGEEFLSSKDTEAQQQRSKDFENDQFQSNFDWPVDAFSPTSWGAGQPSLSSDDSKWDKAVPDTPNSLSAPTSVEEKKGWDFNASMAVEWGEVEPESGKLPNKSKGEWDSSWGQTEWDDANDNVVDERDGDIINEDARAEAEARINELSELETDGASGVDRYEGFNIVEHADCPSRMESRDCASPHAEYTDVLSPGLESKCSEGTMGTATEFDPISMFEASESLEGDVEKKDSFPACAEENDASAVSWGSAKVFKPNNDEASSAFASLRAGAPMDASTLFGQDKSAIETPSGRESLGSWWQNRYASTQQNDVNAAVQEVLNETNSHEEERTDHATDRCASSPRCKPEFATPKQSQRSNDNIFQDPLSSRTKYFESGPPSPDDDSIFGDLDDDSVGGCAKNYSTTKNKSRRKSSLSKVGTVVSSAETDDIFAGVSVSSRQVAPQKETIPMKSLLDGSTTTGSQSMQQKTKMSSKEHESSLPKVEEQVGLFMVDGTHGVINVPDGRNSPTASVTSDITTSVIFGGDFGKKRAFPRRGISSLENDFPDAINEVPDVMSDRPVCSPLNRNAGAQDQVFDKEDAENVHPNPHEGVMDFGTDPNKNRTLVSEATDDGTHQENPSLLKKALLMVQNGKNFVHESTKSKCAVSGSSGETTESNSGFKPSLLMLPLALPLACGVVGASSLAYCATKGNEAFCAPKDPSSSEMATMAGVDEAIDAPNDTPSVEVNSFDEDELALKESQSGTLEDTVESNPDDVVQVASSSDDESNGDESSPNEEAENEDETRILEDEDTADENTLNSFDHTVSSSEEEESDNDESENDEESEYSVVEEGTEITDLFPLSEMEISKWKDWENKDSGCILSPRSKKSLQEEQALAYEKLLFYAYTALTVPLPSQVVEKSEELDPSAVAFPPVLSPRGAELRCEAMKLLLTRLGEDGMEVLKLNREKKWQPRVLTITKEVAWFQKSDDIRYNRIDCCPQGLLWVKKFNGHSQEHSVESIGKSGKGGIMFTSIKSVSVTNDHFSLSKKQKRGKFKDSFTFVLHADFDGTRRDILFRCSNKEDICTLSSGFQAIIDRIKNETIVVPKPLSCQQDKLPMTEDQVVSPVAVAKPFSPKNSGSDDRWEV